MPQPAHRRDQSLAQLRADLGLDGKPALAIVHGRDNTADQKGMRVAGQALGKFFLGLKIDLLHRALTVLPHDGG